MGLTRCEDCGQAVSEQAIACPGCGRPTKVAQTIELTGKKYEFRMLVWGSVLILGAGSAGLGAIAGSRSAVEWGILISLIAAIGYGFARVAAWWQHG